MHASALWRPAVSLLLAARAPPPRLLSDAVDPFSTAGWPALQKELDAMPIWSVANEQGQPLQYEIDGNPIALFYVDVEAAKKELAKSQGQFPELNCDLIPVGLGGAYKLSCEDKALIVPGTSELTAAGAPAGVPAMGQPLPLFACMEMSRDSDTGPVLPLFVSYDDCQAAVDKATAADAPEEPLEIVGLSLPSVVAKLSSVTEGSSALGFAFVPPSASTAHILEYLGP